MAVLGLLAAVLEVWAPPIPVMVVFATLSGLAMVTTGGGQGGGDLRPEDENDNPPPGLDWDAFDAARRGWDRDAATR